MIYDKGRIFLGLAVFVALVASPFWYNPVFGTGAVSLRRIWATDAERASPLNHPD